MSRRGLPRWAVLGLVVGAMIAVVPAAGAGAGEIADGTSLISATVTGPGISEPVKLSDAAGTDLAKAWLASATFSKPSDQPPVAAQVYTVHLLLQNIELTGTQRSTLSFAWDGTRGWFSRGELLSKGKYLPAPGAAVAAMKPVIDAASSGATTGTGADATASSSDDDGSSTVALVVGGVVVLALLAGGFVWLRQRRRGRSTAATA